MLDSLFRTVPSSVTATILPDDKSINLRIQVGKFISLIRVSGYDSASAVGALLGEGGGRSCIDPSPPPVT